MDVYRDDSIRETFPLQEGSQLVANVYVVSDYDEDVCRGSYFGPTKDVQLFCEQLGVAFTSYSEVPLVMVGVVMSGCFRYGVPAYLVNHCGFHNGQPLFEMRRLHQHDLELGETWWVIPLWIANQFRLTNKTPQFEGELFNLRSAD